MAESNTQAQYAGTGSEKNVQGTVINQQPGDSPSLSRTPSQDAEKVEKPPVNPWMDPNSFPDGGAKAWLTVAGASACLFVSFGWVNCVGVFQDYYQTHQLKEYTASDISWIPALQSRGSPFHEIQFANDDSLLHVVWRAICRQGFR